jgi:hypothetical protein
MAAGTPFGKSSIALGIANLTKDGHGIEPA